MRREDRSSISSHPLADLGGLVAVLSHRFAFLVQFLCSCHCSSFVRAIKGRSFVPACDSCGAPRAGAVKTGRFGGHPQGLVLTAPSTVPGSCRLGPRGARPHAFECALLVENRPRNTGKPVGKRDRQDIVV